MPRKQQTSDTVADKSPPPILMQLRKRQTKRTDEIPIKKATTQKKTKTRAKANPPQANQEAKEDSVPSENGERKNNEVPAAGETETKSE
ncbi:non-histone chromosomal protein HMG-14-like isoform X1 [Amblyraja radiata]|uniref:non-histone chromosomal protein HMG-14-like isoform X1 n=1 Tax=Amblyraja radiata TaxID=386614 RepID=UPI00140283F3|nr:non-histone chromosomal protein HMG-14-like isoform X1 [Amblyraja radiata]